MNEARFIHDLWMDTYEKAWNDPDYQKRHEERLERIKAIEYEDSEDFNQVRRSYMERS